MNENKTAADYVTEHEGFADIELSRSATIDGGKVSTIRMREPTVADNEAYSEAKGSEAPREIGMFANLCEIAPDDIRKLPLRDYTRLQAAYTLFTS